MASNDKAKKQRPDFGPVVLTYHSSLQISSGQPAPQIQREDFRNNADAIQRTLALLNSPGFGSPTIMDPNIPAIIYSTDELLTECTRRRADS